MSYHDRSAPGDGGDRRDEEYDPDGPGTTEPRDTLEMQVLSHELDDDDAQASDLEDAFDAALASSYPSARVDSPLGLPVEGTRTWDGCIWRRLRPEVTEQSTLEAAWAEYDRRDAEQAKSGAARDAAELALEKADQLRMCAFRTAIAIGPRPIKATL